MTRAVRPRSLEEATRRLAEEPRCVPVAGGTDLMVGDPLQRLGLPAVLDVTGIPEIRGVRRRDDGGLEVGAATSFTRLREDPAVRRDYPALAAAAAVIGGWQIQNRATLGGNVVNASPAGDSLPVLLALEAEAVVVGAGGERVVPYRDFHTGYRQTALAPGELLAWLRLPPAEGLRQAFRKVGTREAQAISKVVVAVAARFEDGRLEDPRIAAGSVAATPLRLEGAEKEVAGMPADGDGADRAAEVAVASVTPIDDVRSTADYRAHVLGRVVRRLLLELGAAG